MYFLICYEKEVTVEKLKRSFDKHCMTLLLLIMVCLWGGYYEFASAIYCLLFLSGLWLICRKEGKIRIPMHVTTWCLGVIFVCYAVAAMRAADKGVALLGVVKMAAPVLFWIFWNNLPKCRKEEMFMAVPGVGAAVTAVALAGYFHPYLRHYLYRANRLGGIFQYSNTYAMFLLAGLLLVVDRYDWEGWTTWRSQATRASRMSRPKQASRMNKANQMTRASRVDQAGWTWKSGIELVILFLGIIFTGSRSVFVLMLLSIAAVLVMGKRRYNSFRAGAVVNRISRRKVLAFWGGVSLIVLIAVQCFLQLDIGRLLEITFASETFNMRLLYYKDGIGMVLKNPLGLGYMGYYFLQPQFQTGYYTTKFVHNDLLQCALDAGMISAAALVLMVLASLSSKRNTRIKRILLVFLCLHGMFDFDQQFSVMYCLMLMCVAQMDDDAKCVKPYGDMKWMEVGHGWAKGAIVVLGCVSLYFAVALGAAYGRNYTLALRLYPGNTLAAIPLVKAGGRAEAERVISQNGMTVSAYDIASQVALEGQDYLGVLENVREMLRCSGYYLYYYNHALYYLRDAWGMAKNAGDEACAGEIFDEMLGVPKRLERLEDKTSAVAYRTAYPPEFELEREARECLYLLTLEVSRKRTSGMIDYGEEISK